MARPKPPTRPTKRGRNDFARALGEALKQRDLTLEVISARLAAAGTPASTATLSYWQTGRSMPARARSVAVVEVLERILEVPQGSLTRHLGQGTDSTWRARQVLTESTEVEAVLAGWGLDLSRRLTMVSVHESCTVDTVTRQLSTVVRQVMRVESESEHRLPGVYGDDTTHFAPRLQARVGCQIGRQFADGKGLLVTELLLPRAMARGELFWYEFEVQWSPADEPVGTNQRLLPNLVPLLIMDIAFIGGDPAEVEYFTEPADDSQPERRTLAIVDHEAHQLVADAPPGVHALRWTY